MASNDFGSQPAKSANDFLWNRIMENKIVKSFYFFNLLVSYLKK